MSRLQTLLTAVVVTAAVIAVGWRSEDGPAVPPPDAGPSATPSPSGSPSPSVTPVRADPPPAPRPGGCYRLSYDEAVAPTVSTPAVPCREEHTSATYAVGRLDTVVGGHLVAVDSERVRDQVARTCPEGLAGHVGGTLEQRRLSVLRAVWFTPTVEESDAGARWFRCDVIALARQHTLAPLTGTAEGVLGTTAGRLRYGLCATAEPGTPESERVSCATPHSWRAVRTVPFPGDRYPGAATVRQAGEQPCRAAGRAAAGGRLDFRWGYEWPTATQWREGRTWGTCWVPD
ncbi:MAG TPA: septum formation family protein [Nocardioides sp.]|nr:septum formation family protein [Nocardioides sp.]